MKLTDHMLVDLPATAAGEPEQIRLAQAAGSRLVGKKVAIFMQSLTVGGSERATLNLVKGLVQQGVLVDILLADRSGELLSELPPQVTVVDLHGKRVLFSLFPLVRYLRSHRPVILHSILTHASLIAVWAALLARVHTPVIVSQHNMLSLSLASEPSIRNRWIKRLARLFFRYADAAICVSRGVAEDFIATTRMPPRKVHVIYNAVVPADVQELGRQALSHPWFTHQDLPVILAVGRLAPQKDYPTLLRAFAAVCQKKPARLLILGEGVERPHLEMLARQLGLAGQVQMPGIVQNPFAYMAQAQLLVLSSKWEGFGNVLVEALACGTPVVSTDCRSGPREILDDGRFGRLVPVGDAESLAAAILETLKSVPDRALLKQRAQGFTIVESVRKYTQVFESCLLSNG
jgi:glycosyltransferase involved in cell wall biosynthesis